MIRLLILLFIVVPIIELALLIKIGQMWGLGNTLLLVILTGIFGAILLRIQGTNILRRINDKLSQRLIPSEELLDGFFVFCGGLLLISPGILTDISGLLILFPFTRNLFKYWMKKKIKKAFDQKKEIHFRYFKRYDYEDDF